MQLLLILAGSLFISSSILASTKSIEIENHTSTFKVKYHAFLIWIEKNEAKIDELKINKCNKKLVKKYLNSNFLHSGKISKNPLFKLRTKKQERRISKYDSKILINGKTSYWSYNSPTGSELRNLQKNFNALKTANTLLCQKDI